MNVFGGHVEAGEILSEALSRELREELGIDVGSCREIGSVIETDPERNGRNIYHFYVVADWSGEPSNASDEHVDIGWFTPAEALALEPIVSDSRAAIAAYLA
jgi:8-oxo-dGTP diphosphatase